MKLLKAFWRLAVAVGSQALNSISNFLLALLIARQFSPEDVGGWAIAYAILVFTLSVTRALISTPMLISPQGSSAEVIKRLQGGSAFLVIAVGFATSMAFAISGFLVGPSLAASLWGLGLGAWGVLLHDHMRYVAFRLRRNATALLIDALALCLQVAGFGAAFLLEIRLNPTVLNAIWSLSACLAAVVAVTVLLPTVPRPTYGLGFLKEQASTSLRLFLDSFVGAGATAALPILLGLTIGLADLGVYRAGLTLLGVITVLVSGLAPVLTVAVPGLKRRGITPARFVLSWSMFLAVVSVLYWLFLKALPDSAGRGVLGASWSPVMDISGLLILQAALRGPYTAIPILLRGTRQLRLLIRYRLATSVFNVAVPLIGSVVGGLRGALWGIVCATLVANAQAAWTARLVRLP